MHAHRSTRTTPSTRPILSALLPCLVAGALGSLLTGCAATPTPDPSAAPVDRDAGAAPAGEDRRMVAAMDESEAVVRTVERFHEALQSGDSAAVVDLLDSAATIAERGGIESRDEYAAGHLGADMEFLGALAVEDRRTHAWVEGDAAWAVTRTDFTGRIRGREVALGTAELAVLVRRAEGWRIVAIHWSSRSPEDR